MLELLGKFPAQKVFCTGTLPLRMETLFLRNVFLSHDPPTHIFVRLPTFRPELAHHVVTIPSSMPPTVSGLDITVDLANSLRGLLHARERAIIFVMSVADADALSRRLGCAKYYSALGEDDAATDSDAKVINHSSWVQGLSIIIVSTPALVQGIDYPYVRFVVFHGGAYGLISYYQGAGRGGRTGLRCDIFTVRDERGGFEPRERVEDVEAAVEWHEFMITNQCRLAIITGCFDGESVTCHMIPGQQLCDNCRPEDEHHVLALSAVTSRLATHTTPSGTQIFRGSTNKRKPSQSSSDELLWKKMPLSLNAEDFATIEHAEHDYHRKRPRLEQAPASSPFRSSPLH
jgi:superfamily II DNA helicase RecQ